MTTTSTSTTTSDRYHTSPVNTASGPRASPALGPLVSPGVSGNAVAPGGIKRTRGEAVSKPTLFGLQEVWLPIPGWEGKYEVSDQGRVKSFRKYPEGRILKPGRYTKSGHVSVSLGRNNMQPVHLLVLRAFIGPLPRGTETRHLNGVADDNRLSNLCYGTRSKNLVDAQIHGVGRSKFTPEQVRGMREDHRNGETMTSIARRTGVCVTTISYMVNRRTYWWVS